MAAWMSLIRALKPTISFSYGRSMPWLRSIRRVRSCLASDTLTTPPSPAVMFFVGYSEKTAKRPNVPTGRPPSDAPCACAASSNTANSCRAAISPSRSISAGWPYRCTGMMAAVCGVTAASTASGSTQKYLASMSAKTGRAPVSATALAVAANVNDGTITSSPAPMPAASRPRCSPLVPELTATQGRSRPNSAANSRSKAATSGPWASMPLRNTRSTAARSSSPMIGWPDAMKVVMPGRPDKACRAVRRTPRRSAGSATAPG